MPVRFILYSRLFGLFKNAGVPSVVRSLEITPGCGHLSAMALGRNLNPSAGLQRFLSLPQSLLVFIILRSYSAKGVLPLTLDNCYRSL